MIKTHLIYLQLDIAELDIFGDQAWHLIALIEINELEDLTIIELFLMDELVNVIFVISYTCYFHLLLYRLYNI